MSKEKKIDVICFYETLFQKFVIEHLVKHKYNRKKILLIDIIGDKISWDNNVEYCNLSSFKGVFKSWKFIQKIKKLHCNTLVGSHITSHKSRVFASLIKYKNLILTEDGIGTPIIVQDPYFYWNISFSLKFLAKIPLIEVAFFLHLKHYYSLRQILNKIDYYYYIYDNPTNLQGEKINLFYKIENPIFLKGINTGFIGAPFIELEFITKKKYLDILQKISKNENNIVYYPHPSEKWYKNENVKNLMIIEKDQGFEEYVKFNPIPQKIIGFKSTVLLNLKFILPEIETFYIETYEDKYSVLYHDLLLKLGVKKMNIVID